MKQRKFFERSQCKVTFSFFRIQFFLLIIFFINNKCLVYRKSMFLLEKCEIHLYAYIYIENNWNFAHALYILASFADIFRRRKLSLCKFIYA